MHESTGTPHHIEHAIVFANGLVAGDANRGLYTVTFRDHHVASRTLSQSIFEHSGSRTQVGFAPNSGIVTSQGEVPDGPQSIRAIERLVSVQA